jgi:membrane-bound serine protease (ClpP class)
MRRKIVLLILLSCFSLPALLSARTVVTIKVDDVINNVTADFIEEGIDKAEKDHAECLVIELNTPGGLLDATRRIVGNIFDSKVPVIVYVSPGGAHAGSAGAFITLSAHIAAMAPGTNIGAAHPVSLNGKMDSVMGIKVLNDASAFIKAIAENRNRNWQWAIQAVRESQSITAKEALKENVIDLLAANIPDLLHQINGKTVVLHSGTVILQTENAKVETLKMSAADKMLSALSNPNIMYILLLIGIFGIIFELFNPGAILPGVVGVIALILAFYAMSMLPVNYAGVALIIFAVVLFILEIKIISHGILAIGGIISLFLGSMMLVKTDPSWDVVKLSWSVMITSVVLSALFFLTIISIGLKAQTKKPITGIKGFEGKSGEALEDLNPEGMVRVQGEIWNAVSEEGLIYKNEKIEVVTVSNLKLTVKRQV